MMKRALYVVLTLVLLLSLGACRRQGTLGERQIVLRAAHVLAGTHPYNMGMMKLAELLEERTNGQIRVDVFHSAQLGNERELTEAIQLGTVDIALAASSVVANFSPNFVVFDLPFLFETRTQAYAFLDGELGSYFLDELPQFGIIGLGFWETGFSKLTNRVRPISHPSQVAGLNIRTMENAPYMLYFSTLGANPVPMGWGDIFTGLQMGIIDGLTNPITAIYTSQFHTVARYMSLDDSHYTPILLMVSPHTYNRLSPEQRRILREAEEEARHYQRRRVLEGEEALFQAFVNAGGVLVETDREAFMRSAAVQAVYDSIVPSIIPASVIERARALPR